MRRKPMQAEPLICGRCGRAIPLAEGFTASRAGVACETCVPPPRRRAGTGIERRERTRKVEGR